MCVCACVECVSVYFQILVVNYKISITAYKLVAMSTHYSKYQDKTGYQGPLSNHNVILSLSLILYHGIVPPSC